ncbi:hypothetical protein QBC39DRAFT_434309 [Podospora conica]|nr:hypothetical protein QBC39DRAFT_434309 [Schizothecium conicum]
MSSSGGQLSGASSADSHSHPHSADASLDLDGLAESIQREAPELRDHFGDRLEHWNGPHLAMTTPPVAGSSGAAASAAATGGSDVRHTLTIEELCFTSALSCFEGYLKLDSGIGPKTMAYVIKLVTRTLEKTHHLKDVRESLAESVELWIWLRRCFLAAIPSLTTRSISNDPYKSTSSENTPHEGTTLIVKNYKTLKDDLQMLIKLMHIARNLLVVPEPEIPQDLCAAAEFEEVLYETISLCINVTSRAYDGDILDDTARHQLSEISELFKKLLVTSLQQVHNWIAKNDRNKMSFWSHLLCYDYDNLSDEPEGPGQFRSDNAKVEVQNWIDRNSTVCDKAKELLIEYQKKLAVRAVPPGPLKDNSPLSWNWLPGGSAAARADDLGDDAKITPQWNEDEPDKTEQDRLYGRVSREVDTWWLKVRDSNYDAWVTPMPTVEFGQQRMETCKTNFVNRFMQSYRPEDQEGSVHSDGDRTTDGERAVAEADQPVTDVDRAVEAPIDAPPGDNAAEPVYDQDYNDDMNEEEEDVDDDDSYGEGPMLGLLTEIPNILDPKQIEALHMIIKSCILDNAGLALTQAGENLQKTRCRMFLAFEAGRSLLREILVFIAVWEKGEQSLIFQLTTQIVEAIHHSALIPFAWTSLRIPKDIISPAQTVLLRLVNNMFRARNTDPPPTTSREHERDVKLLHFLFIQFRVRIVPDCAALMHIQAQMRNEQCDPSDFPVDSWDMERAKDGLQQFLELLTTVNELPETRAYLIEWEATYELITLLKGLEAGVPKKPLVEPPTRSSQRPSPGNSSTAAQFDEDEDDEYDSGDARPPPPPPMQEPAHKFPWAGIKGQILHILAGLLQPPLGRNTPGNPTVQNQIVQHNGIVPLLNCCVYDDHNRYARERVQICLKWLMEGCDAANNFLRELVAKTPTPNPNTPPRNGTAASVETRRIDGIPGDVKVRLQAPPPAPARVTLPSLASAVQHQSVTQLHEDIRSVADGIRSVASSLPPISPSASTPAAAAQARARSEELLRDIITLADEAARLTMGRRTDAEETEEEDFM